MDVTFIEHAAALDNWTVASSPTRVAMDTEFVRERTYYAQLGLVQVAAGDCIALIDPLGEGSTQALGRLIARCPIVVMHSASEDLEALRVACGTLPGELFDTQIGATLAGFGSGLSLQKLTEATVGVALPKSETRTDWIKRPLSEAQLAYAADDVKYLVQSADVIIERLRELGRLGWAEEDCERLRRAAEADAPNPHPHLSFRPAQRMPPPAQLRVKRLLVWRDAEAQRANKPRGWIIDNSLVIRLAERPPADREELDRLLDATPGAPRKHREALWHELSRAVSDDERDMPLADGPESGDRATLKKMQDAVAKLALSLELPEGALAARRHLETLLLTRKWPSQLEGWRRPLLQPVLEFALT